MSGTTLKPVKIPINTQPAPPDIMNLVSCGCKAGCVSKACSCTKYVLACTAFCKCKGQKLCKNPSTIEHLENDNDSEMEGQDYNESENEDD